MKIQEVAKLTVAELIKRATEKAVAGFGKYSEAELRRLRDLYIEARRRITTQVVEKWGIWVREPTTPLAIGRLRDLTTAIELEIDQLNRQLGDAIPSMVGGAGNLGIQTAQKELQILLGGFPDLIPSFTIMNKAAIDVYSQYALQLSQQYSAEVVRQIQSALQMGLIEQKTVGELTTQIRKYLGAEPRKPAVAITKKAQRIARTEMQRAYSAGHEAYGRSVDFIVGETWHVNPGACEECEELDGKEYYYEKGEEIPQLLHPNCYDDHTEVYTDEGWKLFENLNDKEKILSLNPDNFDLEWLPYIRKIVYPFKGKLYHLYNKWFDLLVTPNHQQLFGRRDPHDRKKIKWDIKSVEEMVKFNEFRIPRFALWNGLSPEFISVEDLKIKTKDFCRFLGYYLSEGSVTKRYQNCYQISITQHNDKIGIIYNDIKGIPVKFDLGKTHIYCYDKRLGRYLLQFGHSDKKFVPDDIKQLSSELIKEFLFAYLFGDGSSRTTIWEKKKLISNEHILFTSSYRMAGDLGELIIKAGGYPSYSVMHTKGKKIKFKNGTYIINNNQNRISWNHSKTAYFNDGKGINLVDYDGYVYDIELPKNHILWVKFNGKTCFSGNCRCYSTYLYTKELFSPEELEQLSGIVKGVK